MTNAQVEVITSVQRRRRWTLAEPGAVASEVARAAGIHVSQLFRWRQQLCRAARTAPAFSPVALVSGPGMGSPLASSTMQAGVEIEFASGAWMRIAGPVDRSTMRAMITALAKAKRRG